MQNTLLETLIANDSLEEYRSFIICKILDVHKDKNYNAQDLQKKSTNELEQLLEQSL